MKTPEEMAEEYANWLINKTKTIRDVADSERPALQVGFLAGYQAAKDYNKVSADFSDFLLSLPAKDQFADTSKVMNSSNNSNGWIPVSERLPEEGQDCIFYVDFIDKWDKGSEIINLQEIGVFNGKDRFYHRSHTHLDRVSYWMPLPKPPEE